MRQLLTPIFVLCFELFSKGETLFWAKTTTGAPHNVTTAVKDEPPDENLDPVEYELGTIIGVIFGVLFGGALIGFAGYMYIKQKRERDRDYTMRTRVKIMSARNAGVYIDTTTQEKLVPDDDYTFRSPDYKAVNIFKNPYQDDSDEELWTSTMRG